MEHKKDINNFSDISKSSQEIWFNIFSYLDLKSFLNLEKSSKYFRKTFLQYYSETNDKREETLNLQNKGTQKDIIPENNISKEKISFPTLFHKDIKKYKKNNLGKYYNCFIQIPYYLAEFCGIYSNKSLTDLFEDNIIKFNDLKSEVNENFSCTSFVNYNDNYKFYDYKNLIVINNNKFMIFYNNTLNVYEINENNIFEKKYFQYFEEKILFFDNIQNSIVLISNCGKLLSMDINDYSTKIKKIRFYVPEEIIQIFYISNHFIFLTKEDNFYCIEYESIYLNIKPDEDLLPEHLQLLHEKFEDKEKSILKLFPNKIKKNYGQILDVKANNNNYLMFIDNNYDIFGLYNNEIKEIKEIKENEKKGKKNNINQNQNKVIKSGLIDNNIIINKPNEEIIFYKICKDVKFPHYYTMSFGDNHWLLLEQRYRLPLNEWTNEEVLNWFEKELGFDDYLKVIKYQKVTGKNILEGDRKYFRDILGMSINKIKQLCNKEIKKVEEGSINGDIKCFGYGSNKYGQLGLLDIKYTKIPKKLEIPVNEIKNNNDFIIKIICSNSISVLITKKGKIYICGKKKKKEKSNEIKKEELRDEKEKEKENQKKRKHNNNKKKKGDKKEKEKEKEKKEENEDKNLWVEISYEIKRNFSNNFYVKIKDLCIKQNVIYIFGLKINKKDFFQ